MEQQAGGHGHHADSLALLIFYNQALIILITFTLEQILPEFCSKLNFILNNIDYSNKTSSLYHEH